MFIECKRPTFRDVYNYVVPKCAHKWRFLGVLLHFDQAELDTIFSNFRNDSEDCCRNLLSRWLEKTPILHGVSCFQLLMIFHNLL